VAALSARDFCGGCVAALAPGAAHLLPFTSTRKKKGKTIFLSAAVCVAFCTRLAKIYSDAVRRRGAVKRRRRGTA
jgi:hypothetical protein